MEFCGVELKLSERTSRSESAAVAARLRRDIKRIKALGTCGCELDTLAALERGLLLERACVRYPRLSLDFLRLGFHQDGAVFPRFGFFPITKNVPCHLMLRDWLADGVPRLAVRFPQAHDPPPVVQDIYRGFTRNLLKKSRREAFEARLSCVVPDAAKRELKRAKGLFGKGKDLFFVAEVKKWEGVTRAQADPLVVGFIGDEAFLVTKFDPTPIEDYVAREFTT